jgi:alpha-ribazole phosphatase
MLVDLIRHGETETPGRLLGRTDPSLSAAGRAQTERQTADRNWDCIISSPRRRTLETAERLAAARDIPLSIDDGWAEMDFGVWDGRSLSELSTDEKHSVAFAALYASADATPPPGGESWADLQDRVGCAIDALLDVPRAGSVLVMTHGGPMRAALHLACGLPFSTLWTLRIVPATRLTLRIGRSGQHGVWAEIVELSQP